MRTIKSNEIPKVPNIQLALSRFEGNPILKPNNKHPMGDKGSV